MNEFNNIIFFVRGIGCLYSRFLYGSYLFFIYIFNDLINIYYLVMFGNCGFSYLFCSIFDIFFMEYVKIGSYY